jgi:hypothetical protein
MADTTSSEDGRRPAPPFFEPVHNWVRSHPALAIVAVLTAQLALSYSVTCGGFEQKDLRLTPLGFGMMMLLIALVRMAYERARATRSERFAQGCAVLLFGLFLAGSWALYFGFRSACSG